MPENNYKDTNQSMQFDAIQIGLASPEKIREWSHGEVKKPETINYRTLKPEKDGLFCEKIFGPQKDWECHCGKYKKIRYKGVVCDRCGVEITKSSVRRERMGHIELAAPVSHIWYFKGIPSRMGLILDLSPRVLERVLYFASYIVLDAGDTSLVYKQVLSEAEYQEAREQYGGAFRVGMGAEAIRELLEAIDLEKDSGELKAELDNSTGQKRARIIKRLEVVEAFRESGNKPEWMIMTVIPENYQPQQPSAEAPGSGSTGHYRPQREAYASGGGGRADRQRAQRPSGDGAGQPGAEIAVRHAKGQGRTFPPEPSWKTSGLLRPFGYLRGAEAENLSVRSAEGDGH